MKTIALAAAALAVFTTVASASECKGLDEAACGSNTACKWVKAHKAGEVSQSSGKPYKGDRKAFCRSGSKKTAAPAQSHPAQQPATH